MERPGGFRGWLDGPLRVTSHAARSDIISSYTAGTMGGPFIAA
jgi:hypothetical protein